MKYDYSKTAAGEELEVMLDSMTGQQIEHVTEIVRTFQKQEEQQKQQKKRMWLKESVLMILNEYAEQTDSILELRGETEEYTEFILENETGFHILDETEDMKLVLLLADYIGIERLDDKVRMDLIFAVKMK